MARMRGDWQSRIVVDPKIMVGKPVIKGTRIPVERIVHLVAEGYPLERIRKLYPRITSEDVRSALSYAAEILADEAVFALPA